MLEDFVLFVAVGFAAQLVDGAIGMAYGLSGTTVMLSFGIPPATASAQRSCRRSLHDRDLRLLALALRQR